MKKIFTTLLAVLPIFCFSQVEELSSDLSVNESSHSEISLFVGLSSYEGDLHCFEDDNLGVTTNAKAAFGLRYNRQFDSNFAASFSYVNTKLNGDDNEFTAASGHQSRAYKFENTIHEISIRGDYMPFGNKAWKVQPFVFVGLGVALGGADTDFGNGVDNPNTDALVRDDMENASKSSFAMPVGFGLKANITEKISIGVEAGLRLFTNDYLDGVSKSANADVNDYYGMGGVTIGYRI